MWQLGTYQGILGPDDALLLVGVGVGVALDGAGLAAEEAVERGADHVGAAGLEGVALGAARLEEVGTLLGITCGGDGVSELVLPVGRVAWWLSRLWLSLRCAALRCATQSATGVRSPARNPACDPRK